MLARFKYRDSPGLFSPFFRISELIVKITIGVHDISLIPFRVFYSSVALIIFFI